MDPDPTLVQFGVRWQSEAATPLWIRAERAPEPQFGPHGDTGAAHATGVVGNLGLVEHDVQARLIIRGRRIEFSLHGDYQAM